MHVLLPHQIRVLQEYEELRIRLLALCAFIASVRFNDVVPAERSLLVTQESHMRAYLDTLSYRLELWGALPGDPVLSSVAPL